MTQCFLSSPRDSAETKYVEQLPDVQVVHITEDDAGEFVIWHGSEFGHRPQSSLFPHRRGSSLKM